MSEPTEILLTDPTRAALADALDRVAPSPMSESACWDAILEEVDASAEGRTQIEATDKQKSGTRYVSAAWWTDHRGVKHVRVCGDDTGFISDWHPHYSPLDDPRPPLWHVFMDRVYRVVTRPGEEARWLASCACGMTGTPQQLAWMGTRCGPCHDRREEGAPHPDDGRPTLFVDRGEGRAVAFSPDGARLAASSAGWNLRLYDLRDGTRQDLEERAEEPSDDPGTWEPLGFSPDGRFLASGVSESDDWIAIVWAFSPTDFAGDMMLSGCDESRRSLAFSPDGRLLAIASDESALDLFAVERRFELLEREPRHCAKFAFSPDSRTLALAHRGGRITRYDTHSWHEFDALQIRATPDEVVRFMHYTPDGRRLVLLTSEAQGVGTVRCSRLHLFDVVAGKPIDACELPREIHVAQLSPDGRYFAYVVYDEYQTSGEIVFFDLVEWSDAARLEWNPDDAINDFAFSGETLATISASGVVKLWPWRLLLEG